MLRRLAALALILCACGQQPQPVATVQRAHESAFPEAVQPALTAPLAAIVNWRAVELLNATGTWNKSQEPRPVDAPHPRPRVAAPASHTTSSTPTSSSARCGGALPPCSVMMRESGGNVGAVNPTGCYQWWPRIKAFVRGCFGKWQVSIPTWDLYGGYDNAAAAPESVQDDFARGLWNGGRGCSHWAAC